MKAKSTLLIFVIGLMLIGLSGCTPDTATLRQQPTTFSDGFWHGIITPAVFLKVVPWPPESSTVYYWGFNLGLIWIVAWFLGGIAAAIRSAKADGYLYLNALLGGITGFFCGCMAGGLICGLGPALDPFFRWLAGHF